jgi:hypothetical protein
VGRQIAQSRDGQHATPWQSESAMRNKTQRYTT